MPASPSQELETLLSHTAWVRSLARSLVSDPHLADDLVQETWVAALERPPGDDRNPRGWLTKVLKNLVRQFHRGEDRRRTREQRVSRREALPPASDLVERVSTQKLVVEAVLELSEPYRTAILMRYFEGLPPRKIAQRLGVPVATVRTRVARGLDRLRDRLDRLHADDRRGWIGAVSLLLPPPGGHAATLIGVLLVDAKQK